MYTLIDLDNEEVTKVIGVNKNMKHKESVDVLFNKKVTTHNVKRIQNKFHRIGTYVCKISLSCFHDKRYILEGCVNNLAYFHKDIIIILIISWFVFIRLVRAS